MQTATAAAGVEIFIIHPSISSKASFNLVISFGVAPNDILQNVNIKHINNNVVNIIYFIEPPF